MVKIFNLEPPFSDKLNIVDSDNNFIGIDTGQSCCEEFIIDIPEMSKEFLKDAIIYKIESYNDEELYITLKNNFNQVYTISILNNHNGYYAHTVTTLFKNITKVYEI